MLGAGTPFENPLVNGYGRNPYASLTAGPGAWQAAPNGLFLGRFAWADPVAGIASNVYQPGLLLGYALQTFNSWNRQRVIAKYGSPLLMGGMPCVLASRGDFLIRFLFGATPGLPVYANPATGQASVTQSGPAPVLDSSGNYVLDSYGDPLIAQGVPYIPTPWVVMTAAGCSCAARISNSLT